jgi:hypothetical protein
MADNALATFIRTVRAGWGPTTTELVAGARAALEALARAPADEPWLAALRREAPANRELHRDPDHGFVLLAHTEQAGLYRPPHDHGRAWVIYAVQHGAIEMGTYGRVTDADGQARLVARDRTPLRAGEAQVYLPGDIHDTRCLTPDALLFRFTERDLRVEDREARRLTRYVDRDGAWRLPAA